MPRGPRSRRAPGWLEPGQVYHVTNRGVDRCPIFHSDLDRIIFMSMFAEACLRFGVVCHAWCLMDSHYHAVVEDTRGVLSQFCHRFASVYVRYFNDTRVRKRGGPLFESRFRAELIDSVEYFEDACAYVLLNPMETKTPLARSAESYRWSSASFVCGEVNAAESVGGLLTPMGGVDAILSKLPASKRKRSLELRRTRLDALASGRWVERDHLLAGRSADEYRRMLAARVAIKAARDGNVAEEKMTLDAARLRAFPGAIASKPPFAGFDVLTVMSQIRTACEVTIPEQEHSAEWMQNIVLYALHRFTTATTTVMSKLTGVKVDRAHETIERLAALRQTQMGWQRLLWALEWRLRWWLRAAPYRP